MKFATLARIAPVLALFSCAPPKAVVIEAAPVKKTEKTEEAVVATPPFPDSQNDGLRFPQDMEAMPGDSDFRATVPVLPRAGSEGNAVISRPPTDPPSRPKPKETGTE